MSIQNIIDKARAGATALEVYHELSGMGLNVEKAQTVQAIRCLCDSIERMTANLLPPTPLSDCAALATDELERTRQ